MIEKLTVHFIGVLCIRSYDVISNVKVLEHPQILNGVDSNNNLLYVHAIQGHSGGELIALELNVAIPLRWKDYHHVGSTSTVNSLQAGLIAGGKDAEEGQTVFFTILDPVGAETTMISESQEKYTTRTSGTNISQDAVYWVTLEKAQDKGLQFWQTRSHTIILSDSVPTALRKE